MMSGYLVDNSTAAKGEALLVRALPMVSVFDKIPVFGNGSIKFSHVRNPIADFLIASTSEGTPASVYRHEVPVLQECVLSWCVQTIKSSYDYGKYTEETIERHFNETEGPFPWTSVGGTTEADAGADITYAEDIVVRVEPGPESHGAQIFGTTNNTAYAVMSLFNDMFPSFFTALDESTPPMLRYQTHLAGPAYIRELTFNPWLMPNNVAVHTGRLATAITNVVRSSSDPEWLEGKAYSMENFVSVRWEWLTLPLGLLFMSLIFLAATVFKSAHEKEQVDIFKNSAILTLLHGIPDDMRGRLTRSSSTGTPRAKAKELKVRLHPKLGWRMSGNVFSPLASRLPRAQPPPGWI